MRANIAFENMVAAVLFGSAASGAVLFVLKNAVALVKGAWGLATLVSTAMGAVYFVFLAFLGGFLAAVVVAMPLFLVLERVKLRKIWPYAVAAAAVGYVALWVIYGLAPFDNPAALIYLAPGILMAVLFGRRMRPIWRAAERSESQPAIFRIH